MIYNYVTTSTSNGTVSGQGADRRITLDNIELEKAKLEAQEQLLIKSGLQSNDAETLVKATAFLQ